MPMDRQNGILTVFFSGRIDGSNVSEFEKTVIAAVEDCDRALIMDFEQLSFISSAGLRVILIIAKALRSQDTGLSLCSLSDHVGEIFRISGFDKVLTIHSSRSEALAAAAV
ncbi:MAG: STAS domain-containing protein [Halieaceae bacterium]|nr:STAS domain-containing protein [Halieaceae bacterium]